MALINRLATLVRADVHAVLDSLEEPEQVLRQAIRDMENELAAAEQRISLCDKEHAALERRITEVRGAGEEIRSQLDLCFDSGKEELARSLVRRKLEARRVEKRLVDHRDGCRRFLEEERAALRQNRDTLDALRQKAELIPQRTPIAGGHAAGDDISWPARELHINDDEVEIEFLREKEARRRS